MPKSTVYYEGNKKRTPSGLLVGKKADKKVKKTKKAKKLKSTPTKDSTTDRMVKRQKRINKIISKVKK